jgi:hypothetical protein
MSNPNRNLRASRSVSAYYSGGERPRPLAFVEAACLAPTGQSAQLIVEAARQIADDAAPTDAAREIVATFLGEVPLAADAPTPDRGNLDGPGAPAGCTTKPIAPAKTRTDETRRSVADMAVAVDILELATLQVTGLADVAREAADACLGLAERRVAPETAQQLLAWAKRLLGASKAAGTEGAAQHFRERSTSPADRAIEAAIVNGIDATALVSAIRRFDREFTESQQAGHRLRVSRARYLEINIAKWRAERRTK